MLEQILTQAMSHVQLITAVLLLTVAVLEFVHIGQTSRINKKLSRAGRWLQRYLNAVFSEETYDEPAEEETKARTEIRANTGEKEMQLTVAQPLKSRQEEEMRNSIARKKQKRDEELLESVLQEIFD